MARPSQLTAHQSPISVIAFHPDGSRIVTVGMDDTVRVFAVLPLPPRRVTPRSSRRRPAGNPVSQPIGGGPGRVYHVQAWCGEIARCLTALSPGVVAGRRRLFQGIDPLTGQFNGLRIAAADGSNAAHAGHRHSIARRRGRPMGRACCSVVARWDRRPLPG